MKILSKNLEYGKMYTRTSKRINNPRQKRKKIKFFVTRRSNKVTHDHSARQKRQRAFGRRTDQTDLGKHSCGTSKVDTGLSSIPLVYADANN